MNKIKLVSLIGICLFCFSHIDKVEATTTSEEEVQTQEQDEVVVETSDVEAVINYQPFSTVEDILSRLQNYTPSGLTGYETVIDQLFSINSLMDFFNPYYYYSINTESRGDRETNRSKIVSEYCDPYHYEVAMTNADGTFEHVGCLDTYEEAENLKSQFAALGMSVDNLTPVVLHDGMVVMSLGPAVVQFKTTGCGANHNLYAREGSDSSFDTYVNACYIDDAKLVDESGDYLQIYMSGYDGWVSRHAFYDSASSNEIWVNIIPEIQVKQVSHYKVENGELVHYLSKDIRDELAYSSLLVGVAPSFLEEGKTYYSYDGRYFYEQWQNILVSGAGAVNENEPFYNYFQYLPYRSKTNYRPQELDAYLTAQGYTEKATVSPANEFQSQLVGEGESFIAAQEQFGINGALEMAMAIHESGFGRSKISIEKNNSFGMNATDNNPYGNATQFSSIRNGIFYHAERYMSWGYTDAVADFRYFGPHVGNKGSGMNVKYASDPYWGEKIASHYYKLDKASGMKDYNYYQLAIKQGNDVLNVVTDATESGSILYKTMNNKSQLQVGHYPFLVTNEENNYFKIQSDVPISSADGTVKIDSPYDFLSSVGYVPVKDLYRTNAAEFKEPHSIKQYLELNVNEVLELAPHLSAYDQVEIKLSTDHVVSLDESLNLIAVDAGFVSVEVYNASELVGVFDVRVNIPVESVSITSEQLVLEVGETLALAYELLPVNASHQSVLWVSSDAAIATVDRQGVVSALAEGDVVISILSEDGGHKDEIKLKVKK